MWKDLRYRLSGVILAGAALVAVTACGDDDGAPTGPDDDDPQAQTATVVGSIETTLAGSSSSYSRMGRQFSQSTGAAQASRVAIAAVRASGSLEVLAEAEVQANGRFSIEDVPAGERQLIVLARSSSGEEVGRVLVQGETRVGSTIVAEPLNAETSVEGLVLESLVEAGVSEDLRNTGQLALMIRLDEGTAQQIASSPQAIQEVAGAFRSGVEAQNQSFAEMGADLSAQRDGLIDAAIQHAESRDGGMDPVAAQETFVRGALDAFALGGVEGDEIALASAAATTGLDQAGAVSNDQARLELARNAVSLNLTAREDFVGQLSSSEETSAAADALVDARARLESSTSVAGLSQGLEEIERGVEEDLASMILSKLPADLPASVRTTIEGRLQTAFAEACLSGTLGASAEIQEIVQIIRDYRGRVDTAVQGFASELPGEVSVESFSTDLLVVTHGSPAVGAGS